MGTVFIYGLVDPRDKRVRYVGKTVTSLMVRLGGHVSAAKKRRENNPKAKWIRSLLTVGLKPEMRVLCESDNEAECYLAEQRWMNTLPDLLNQYPAGGGPGKGHLRGRKKSPEHAEFLREQLRGVCRNGKGRAQTSEDRSKKSLSARHRWGKSTPAPTPVEIAQLVHQRPTISLRGVATELGCSFAYVRQCLLKSGTGWIKVKENAKRATV